MGGEGTWSLAAADPKRWAAIVPVSHGGDTKSAARLIDVPCWCFHGDADKMIPALRSREMIQAIKDAGVSLTDIDHVVLVGGSTRMPMIVDLVKGLTH